GSGTAAARRPGRRPAAPTSDRPPPATGSPGREAAPGTPRPRRGTGATPGTCWPRSPSTAGRTAGPRSPVTAPAGTTCQWTWRVLRCSARRDQRPGVGLDLRLAGQVLHPGDDVGPQGGNIAE